MGVRLLSGSALAPRRALPALALALAAAAPLAAAPAAPAPTVVAVELRSDVPVDRRELGHLIAIRPGAPLDEESVRSTLIRLRLAGLASEIEVLRRAAPGGVVAVVVLHADVRVETVELAGELALERQRLLDAVPQKAGQPLREDRLLRGVYRLEETYEAQGYVDARVTLDVAVDEATRRARVTYRLAPGVRWQIGNVRIEGLGTALTEEEVVAALRARPGEPYRGWAVRGDEDRLARFLTGKGFRQATIEVLPESRDAARRAVDLGYRVVLGPRVEIEVTGADRRQLEKRGLLPILGEAGYDEALLLQTVDSIRAFYQERGHYRVAVRTREEREGERLRVRLEVEPGPKLTLEEVAFEGNRSFPSERLAQLMTTSPRRLLLPKSGRLVDEELGADLSNLRSFYALQGFASARVGPPRVVERGDELRLTVPVVEGPRQIVGTLDLEGIASLDREQLRRRLPLAPGGPFHRVLLDDTLAAVRAAYEAEGFRAAIVSGGVEWSDERSLAAVTVRVLEGQRTRVGAVVLRGTQRTRTEVVRRFVEIAPGDPVSTASLLEVQRRLYGLGLFSRVDVPTAAARCWSRSRRGGRGRSPTAPATTPRAARAACCG